MIPRPNRFVLLRNILFLTVGAVLHAQEPSPDEIPPGLRDKAIVMEIAARIVEQNEEVVWNSENMKITIPGRPVRLQLVGTNVIVAVQFTPFFRRRGDSFLVAQGQIWIQTEGGVTFFTCMETIPMAFGEQIYFFPLGSEGSENTEQNAQIEIQLVLHPYQDAADPEGQETPE